MSKISDKVKDFKSIERGIYEIMCRVACELMQTYLETRDKSIMGERDTGEYRCIDKRTTTIKTMMGEV